MAQGKRVNGMVKGSMGDMFNSIARPLSPEQIKRLRMDKVRFLRPDRNACPVEVVDDDGDVPGTLCAFFCTESHLRFTVAEGRITVLGIYRDHNDIVSGRQMLAWLRRKYGDVKINVNEVAPDAVGFWIRMEQEGWIDDWKMDSMQG